MSDTYKPTESMASAARRGLEMRDKQSDSNKCCTSVGLTRASQLASRKPLSLDTVKRMYSFFSRHEVDKKSASWKKGDSKGEQAWLLWGGDAGYSWSRKIVESEKKGNMSNNILLVANIKKSQIKDTGTHWEIKSIPVTVDDAVMNGILYPANENKLGMPSLIGKPISLTHPIDDNGNFISAMEGQGLEDFFGGGTITNTYNMNGVNYADASIKKKMMEGQDNSKWFVSALNSKEDIGVSTGLIIPSNDQAGKNKDGEEYTQTAINQVYNHLALLEPDEAPAGGDKTFMRFNAQDNESLLITNVGDYMKTNSEEEQVKGFFAMCKQFFASNADKSYNDEDQGHEAESQTNNAEVAAVNMKDKMMSRMKKMGMNMDEVKNMGEDEMFNAMMSYAENMGSKKSNEDTGDKEDKPKEKMAKNSADEEAPAWAKDMIAANAKLATEVESMKADLTANAQGERDALISDVVSIGILSKEEATELSTNSLTSHKAKHGGHLNVNSAAGGFNRHNSKALSDACPE